MDVEIEGGADGGMAQQFPCHRDFTLGVPGLGLVDNNPGESLISVRQVEPLEGFVYVDYARGHVNIVPLQGTDFADAKPGGQFPVDELLDFLLTGYLPFLPNPAAGGS